jgi:hypothetical protein
MAAAEYSQCSSNPVALYLDQAQNKPSKAMRTEPGYLRSRKEVAVHNAVVETVVINVLRNSCRSHFDAVRVLACPNFSQVSRKLEHCVDSAGSARPPINAQMNAKHADTPAAG